MVFGPKRLGELGKGLGQGVRAFREGFKDDKLGPEHDAAVEGRRSCAEGLTWVLRPSRKTALKRKNCLIQAQEVSKLSRSTWVAEPVLE
jgi:Sec-independent protein translocase protein TatA